MRGQFAPRESGRSRTAPLVQRRPAAHRRRRPGVVLLARHPRPLGAVGQRRHQGGRPRAVRARVAAARPAGPRRRPRPGLQRPSCVACHFQGGVGGGGDNEHNVMAFEALPTRTDPRSQAAGPRLRRRPSASARAASCCRRSSRSCPAGRSQLDGEPLLRPDHVPDFDPVRTESVNPTALFGAGWIDRISDQDDPPPEPAGRSLAAVGQASSTATSSGVAARAPSRAARRPRRQVRLEGPVRHARGVRRRRLRQRDRPGQPR